MNQPGQVPNILVVDDTVANLHLLNYMLKKAGYRVRPVTSGPEALSAAESSIPDLILLDINMPEMDGLEVCRRLKERPALKDVPVLFISALSETADRVKGFAAGGVDYIPKPFQLEEVEARVATHLELAAKRRALEQSVARLRELEQLRDSLVHMVVHDMRSPLSVIMLSLDMIKSELGDPGVEIQEMLHTAQKGAVSLNEMVSSILDLSRMEAGLFMLQKTSVDLVPELEQKIHQLGMLSSTVGLQLEAPDSLRVDCDLPLVLRVVANLVGNAFKFSPQGSMVLVRCQSGVRSLRISVVDHGIGIAEENHLRIFDKFGQVHGENRRLGFGLGLTFCKLAVEAHGGTIGLVSSLGKGSTFWFELPLQEAGEKSSPA